MKAFPLLLGPHHSQTSNGTTTTLSLLNQHGPTINVLELTDRALKYGVRLLISRINKFHKSVNAVLVQLMQFVGVPDGHNLASVYEVIGCQALSK